MQTSDNDKKTDNDLERTFTGEGLGDNDWVRTYYYGTDINAGNRIVISSVGEFEVLDRGIKKYNQKAELYCSPDFDKGLLLVRSKNGQNFNVKIIKS
jgi:hypothetical protein